ETLQVPLVAGRRLAESDGVDAPAVIVINQVARQRFFASQDPIGQRIRFWGAERLVVGVVGNERFHGLTAASPPGIYAPLAQVPMASGSPSVLVRVHADPAGFAGTLRRAVGALDPGLPLFGVEPLTRTVSDSMGQQRFTLVVLVVFAAVALLLAVIGVHGVLS